MGDVYKRAKGLFEKELEKIVDKGDITPANLDYSYKLIDIIKDIDEVCAMDNAEREYEDEYSGRRSYRNGYSRNYPYENYSYRGSYQGNPGYSGNSMIVSKLHNLMNEASNEKERMMIQSWLNEVEN